MSEGKDGFVPNPVLAGLVGICPLIAVSRSLAEATVYGLGAALCSIVLGAVAPPLRSVIADRLQAPAMLALSSALALVYGFLTRIYSPTIAAGLWIYSPLLAVSGLSLSTLRRSSLPGRIGPDGQSRLGAVAFEAVMFLFSAAFIGAAREIVGLGTLTLPVPGPDLPRLYVADFAPLRILVSTSGGFILLGFVIAAYRTLARVSGRKLP
jgi:electron transport complex protein RnfE